MTGPESAETAYATSPAHGNPLGPALALLDLVALIADPLVERVIGCAIAVHRAVGPGLFESVYDRCLHLEFDANSVSHRGQVPLTLTFRGQRIPSVYRADFIVEDRLLVELKTVDRFAPVHQSQMLTYLKLSGLRQGLLINFNERRLVDGLKSFLR